MLGYILHNLEVNLGHILKWLKVNSLEPNPGKFQFIILGTNTDIKVNLFLDENKIQKSQEVVLLGINVDDKLSFKMHVVNNFRKAKYKLHTLQRIRKYLSTYNAKTLCDAFINNRLYYAPIIWMFAEKLLI